MRAPAKRSGYLDGTGTAAEFNSPYGVAVDSNGNVYVADSANYVIRKIASGGAVTTLAGHAGSARHRGRHGHGGPVWVDPGNRPGWVRESFRHGLYLRNGPEGGDCLRRCDDFRARIRRPQPAGRHRRGRLRHRLCRRLVELRRAKDNSRRHGRHSGGFGRQRWLGGRLRDQRPVQLSDGPCRGWKWQPVRDRRQHDPQDRRFHSRCDDHRRCHRPPGCRRRPRFGNHLRQPSVWHRGRFRRAISSSRTARILSGKSLRRE